MPNINSDFNMKKNKQSKTKKRGMVLKSSRLIISIKLSTENFEYVLKNPTPVLQINPRRN